MRTRLTILACGIALGMAMRWLFPGYAGLSGPPKARPAVSSSPALRASTGQPAKAEGKQETERKPAPPAATPSGGR